MAIYKELSCSSACNRVQGRFPFKWDMNIYRGCEHGCKYCFAMYSHQYLGSEAYFSDIFVKTNIVEQLEKQFASPSWKREIVSIGGVTDSYQPAEEKYKLMPEILRLFIKYKNPCIISTKSDLILRDYALIDELSRLAYVNIAATITCIDETTRKKLEPGSVPSERRFAMLKAFSKTGASTGLHVMPIIPYLTDTRENLDALFAAGRDSAVTYVMTGALYLRGRTRQAFFDFIRSEYPELCKPLFELYKTGSAGQEYKAQLYPLVNALRNKYGLSTDYRSNMKVCANRQENRQLSLFD